MAEIWKLLASQDVCRNFRSAFAERSRRHRQSEAARNFLAYCEAGTIALANKLARMTWAMMATGERYNYPASLKV